MLQPKGSEVIHDFDPVSTGARVLLIDDDTFFLEIFEKKIIEDGFNVATRDRATDGAVPFIDDAAALMPDIIITGIMMPGRDGFEAISLLKADPRTAPIPVVVLSSMGGMPDVIDKTKKLGAVLTIAKSSMTPSDLVEVVRGVIRA